jgi:hypothetical protein
MTKYWSQIRKIGKINFIIIYAFLLGLLMALFSSLIAMAFDKNFDSGRFVSSSAFGMLVGGFLGGLISGTAQWYYFENRKTNK